MKTIREYVEKDKNLGQVREAINSILDNFDFEKVHRVMSYLNWTWRNDGVPSVDYLKNEVRKLIVEALTSEDIEYSYHIATGGFDIRIEVDNLDFGVPDDFEHKVNIHVAFELEYWDTIW